MNRTWLTESPLHVPCTCPFLNGLIAERAPQVSPDTKQDDFGLMTPPLEQILLVQCAASRSMAIAARRLWPTGSIFTTQPCVSGFHKVGGFHFGTLHMVIAGCSVPHWHETMSFITLPA
jgi:hypothetical protein